MVILSPDYSLKDNLMYPSSQARGQICKHCTASYNQEYAASNRWPLQRTVHTCRSTRREDQYNPSLLHNHLCSKINILMVTDSLESSTKMPIRQNGRYLPLLSFVFKSNSRARRAPGWLFGCMIPPVPGINSHCTLLLPRAFPCTYLHPGPSFFLC